jgi:hypothetical protein
MQAPMSMQCSGGAASEAATVLSPGLQSVPEDTPVSSSPPPIDFHQVSMQGRAQSDGGSPKKGSQMPMSPGSRMLSSSDVSSLVLEQAVPSFLLNENCESEEFERCGSMSSDDDGRPGVATLNRSRSGLRSAKEALDGVKRGFHRMMIDRNTLHEFDLQREPRKSLNDYSDAEIGAFDFPGSDLAPSRSSADATRTMQVPAKRLVTRAMSLDMRTSVTRQGVEEPLQDRPSLTRSRLDSMDRRRSMAKEKYNAHRKKINTFATVLRQEDSWPRVPSGARDVDQKYTQSGGAADDDEAEDEGQLCVNGSVPLHPNSAFRMGWDAIMFVTTVFALIADPISIAFAPEEQSPDSFFVVSDRIVMSIFFCDIILNFLTGEF